MCFQGIMGKMVILSHIIDEKKK